MIKKRVRLIIVLSLVLFAVIVIHLNFRESKGHRKVTGTIDFTGAMPQEIRGKLLLKDLSGGEVALADYYGKPHLLVFFASWCHPCKMEIPHLNKIHGNGSVEVVAVNLRESKSRVERFIREQQISYTVLLDERGETSKIYRVNSIPSTFLINPDGTIAKHIAGYNPSIESIVNSWLRGL